MIYTLPINLLSPASNAVKGGDIDTFSENVGISKYIITPILTALYGYSIYKIYQAADKNSEKGFRVSYNVKF